MNITKFLAAYYGAQTEDFDGIDGYTMDEHTLESIIKQAIEIEKNPSHLDTLVNDANTKGILLQKD
jgi:hypothetical protein